MMPGPAPISDRELTLERLLDAPADKLFRCWTEIELMKRWFCPPPWKVTDGKVDVRAGGKSYVLMEGPDGAKMPNHGLYLEVVPNRKLVFTDAFVNAWEPGGKPFMVATVTFTPEGDKTRYVARVQHWTVEDRKSQEEMGFHQGWGIAADQLEKVARAL
jgi:uncharacterized protein YndB with AHSA1/START domain